MLTTCALSKAQMIDRELISPAGGFFENSSIQVAWVIGDLCAGHFDIGHISTDPTVNVPWHSAVISRITVYPNPTTDKVFLEIDMENIDHCMYFLFDLQGREIQNNNITSKLTELSFAQFESGVYIMKVIKENTLVQEIKIVKR
jgi:hypothetical protein